MTQFIRQRWPETLLATLAGLAALKYAEAVMAPLILAFVIALVLTPIQNRLLRIGVPVALASTITLMATMLTLVGIALLLRPWVNEVIISWPGVVTELRSAALDLRYKLSGVFDMQREVMEAITPAGSGAAGGGGEGNGDSLPTLADAAWLAPQLGAQFLIFLGGLFFFLYGKERAYDWAKFIGFRPSTFRLAEERVASYFAIVSVINAGLGIAVGLALTAYGLPGAPVWGLVAALANFVIYLGPAVTAAMLLLAGTVAFDGLAVVGVPIIYLSINLMEAQFVTPMLIGQRMRLDPLLVFLSLTVWLWLWGPIGGIVAIPLVLWFQSLWKDSSIYKQGQELILSDTTRDE
ncbi:AI-2E family transporter [Rhodobacter sp. NTK016B]|uniref:AI-2E family transporter n=1 Tax=Rhodobacter sp. NTK016B TaxID=2759676 RepID=UPI001A8EBF76|nr:AI-2E family transporter [Rhodobacter sp. NTK016B]MBN8293099.1 AI-2E family transporter [Rhodobacter sp. NTK016B]